MVKMLEQHVTKKANSFHHSRAGSIDILFTCSGAGSKFINTNITNYTQECPLNCFMVYLIFFYEKFS